MEMTVQRGRGYSPAEERGRLPVGEIPTDAIFSPVKRVNWDVKRARVGQDTGFDKLIMEIWTDGTIAPEEALSGSAAILIVKLLDPGIRTAAELVPAMTAPIAVIATRPTNLFNINFIFSTPCSRLTWV